MYVERGAASFELRVGGVHWKHTAAAVEIGDITRRQPVPGAAPHALGEDGVEDHAACRRQHEAGIVAAAPRPIAASSFGQLLGGAQHLFQVSGLASEALLAEIVRRAAAADALHTLGERPRVAGEAAYRD